MNRYMLRHIIHYNIIVVLKAAQGIVEPCSWPSQVLLSYAAAGPSSVSCTRRCCLCALTNSLLLFIKRQV
jgi:hypothetical protein